MHRHAMASRGRHQSTSKECRALLQKIEAIDGVIAVIIGRSYGGKSLGAGSHTGSLRVQRLEAAGIKAVMQSSKGLQEIFIRTREDCRSDVSERIKAMDECR